jgi:hypothetical protein
MVAHPTIGEQVAARRRETRATGDGCRARNRSDAAEAGAPMSAHPPGGVEHSLPARTRMISPTLLLPAEIIIFEIKPSRWYMLFAAMPWLTVGVALVLLANGLAVLPGPVRSAGIIVGSSIAGLGTLVALFQWSARTYVLTDRRVITQAGVLNVAVESMGLEQIENTFVAQAAGQRLCGIGNIFFRCAGSPQGCLVWEHVTRAEEVHARVVLQIDRWKHALEMTKP